MTDKKVRMMDAAIMPAMAPWVRGLEVQVS